MNINFELYKVFYYAALYLNFSEAGKKLFISQSAVSQSVKQLENQLGIPLFFRNKRKLSLTPQGADLFTYIEKAFVLIDSGEKRIISSRENQIKELKIAASDTICKYYLLPYFKIFNQNNPKVTLRIINRPSPQCRELAEKGAVDIAVVNLPEKTEAYSQLNLRIIKKIRDIFIGGEKFAHLKNQKLSLKEIARYPLLLLEKNSTTRRFFDDLTGKHNVSALPEIEIESIDLLIELTKIGLGISFVPQEAALKEIEKGSIFPLESVEKIPGRNIGFLYNKELPLSENGESFMNLFA